MEKSYVTMEQHKCVVCCKDYDTGAILMDTRLRPRFERNTLTGMGLCPACEALSKDYLALIEIDPTKSNIKNGQARVLPQDTWRTGRIFHMKRSAAQEFFNIGTDGPCAFIEPALGDKLQEMMGEAK